MTRAETRARTVVRACAPLLLLASVACPGTLPYPEEFETDDAGPAGTATAAVDGAAAPMESGSACPDIPTLLAKSCGTAGCHDATTQAEALDLASPDVAARLVGVPASEGAGLLIDPGAPSDSVLYTKLLATPPFGARMPTGMPLDTASIQCVLAWVTSEGSASGPDGGATATVEAGVQGEGAAPDAGATGLTTLRVAAGQAAAVADAQGNMWSADENFTGGTAAVTSPAAPIAGTDSPALYNGQRYGDPSFSYQFTVPDGAYTVVLKFTEQFVTGPGMRLFDVAINGTAVETQFDIYATAGAMNVAVDRTYPIVVAGGVIEIAFTPGTIQSPKVDAIQIRPGSADGGT